MTCTWGGGDKGSTIKDFRGESFFFKLLSKFPSLGWRGSVPDTEVRQDQSIQRQEHLLGPNWSPLQLNDFLWLRVYFSFAVCAQVPSP